LQDRRKDVSFDASRKYALHPRGARYSEKYSRRPRRGSPLGPLRRMREGRPAMKTRKKTTPGRSKATRFTHKKFRWLDQLSIDRELPPLALRVCIQFLPGFNLDYDGSAWFFQDTIAARLGVRRETVNRVLNAVVARGHLESIKQGRDKPNVYRMVLKDEAATIGAQPADRPARCDQRRTSSDPMMCAEDVTNDALRCDQPVTQTPFKTPGAPKGAPKEERETVAQERDYSSSDVAAALGGPRAEEKEESKQAHGGDGAAAAPLAGEIIPPGSFEELRLVYDRGHLDDDQAARKAFKTACREVAPEVIIEAAKVWVAAADAPRFLKPLDVWLDRRGWAKAPLPKPAAGSAARGRSPHRRNGHRLTMAQVAARLVR
jgi:hypothetical protein